MWFPFVDRAKSGCMALQLSYRSVPYPIVCLNQIHRHIYTHTEANTHTDAHTHVHTQTNKRIVNIKTFNNLMMFKCTFAVLPALVIPVCQLFIFFDISKCSICKWVLCPEVYFRVDEGMRHCVLCRRFGNQPYGNIRICRMSVSARVLAQTQTHGAPNACMLLSSSRHAFEMMERKAIIDSICGGRGATGSLSKLIPGRQRDQMRIN